MSRYTRVTDLMTPDTPLSSVAIFTERGRGAGASRRARAYRGAKGRRRSHFVGQTMNASASSAATAIRGMSLTAGKQT
jgi:hypothetical protein